MYLHASDVAAHTTARNDLNAAAIALREELTALLTPYVGKKIRRVSGYGGWVAKLTPVLEALQEKYRAAHSVSFHFEFSCYSFWVEVKAHYPVANGGGSVCYVKKTLSLGKWDEKTGELQGLLTVDEREVSNPKTDWRAADIVTLQARIASLKKELGDAESVMRCFV
jgi:hypothetical protein